MKTYEIKNTDGGVLDVDDTSRRVKVAFNKVGVMDSDKDIIERTAFDKTIRERGPQGSQLIWHLTDHRASLKDAVGKPKEVGVENDYLYAVTDIPNTSWGNDVMEFYKSGAINQHSIGFSTIKREVFNDDNWDKRYTVIKEVKLYEGSAVLWGANEFTPTLTVGKSFTPEERKSEFEKTLEEYTVFTKLFKTGHLSDQSFELLEMRIAQLNEKLKNLYIDTTQPVVKTVEPVDEVQKWAEALTNFTNKLKAV
jgi:HK97 family phage prohead protease